MDNAGLDPRARRVVLTKHIMSAPVLKDQAKLVSNRLQARGIITEQLPFISLRYNNSTEDDYACDSAIIYALAELLDKLDRHNRETTSANDEIRKQAKEITRLKQENAQLQRKLEMSERQLSDHAIASQKQQESYETLSTKLKSAHGEIKRLRNRNDDLVGKFEVESRKHARGMVEIKERFNPLKRLKLSGQAVGIFNNLATTPGSSVALAVETRLSKVVDDEVSDLKEIVGQLLTENYYYENFTTKLCDYLADLPAQAQRRRVPPPEDTIRKPDESSVDLEVHLTTMKRFDQTYPLVLQELDGIRTYLNLAKSRDDINLRDLRQQLKDMKANFEQALATLEQWKQMWERQKAKDGNYRG